jgi:hypothetical protein
MYLDVLGLVTTAIGVLIDPVEYAIALPWHWRDKPDVPATAQEICDEWTRIKRNPKLAQWGHRPAEGLTNLRLSDEAVEEVTLAKADQMVVQLEKRFSEWDAWPADAQLGVLSMAWAMGPAFWRKFPAFDAAARAQDWSAAGRACSISTKGNPGIIPRNRHNERLFRSAAYVVDQGLDRERLWWPAGPESLADTVPELPG